MDRKGSNHLSNCINKVKSAREWGQRIILKASILLDYLGCVTKSECRIRNCVFLEFMNVEIGVRKMGKIDVALLRAK